MKFVLGAIGLSSAVFYYCFILLGARNPRRPWWASDTWLSNYHCVVLIALGLAGLMGFGTAALEFQFNGLNMGYLAAAALILLATVAGVRAMRIGQRLADYQALELRILSGVATDGTGPDSDGHRPQTPPLAA